MKKCIAFTLAETLIVMGIIGVVAALTLPNLNSSTGDKEKIVKVKKINQNLQDAYGRAISVYGPIQTWFVNDSNETAFTNRFCSRLTEFLKSTKDCGTSNAGCFGVNLSTSIENRYYKYYNLADGSSLGVTIENKTGGANMLSGYHWMGWIFADIDGPNKGKNEFGNDIHMFALYTDTGLVPNGYNYDNEGNWNCNVNPAQLNNADNIQLAAIISSVAWIMQFDNMDYLKLDSSGHCPNGRSLTISSPSCK